MQHIYKASVIIPTYNRDKLLEMTLASLTTQTISANDFEVIIVDDGSDDGTLGVIKKFEKVLNIQFLYHSHNETGIAKSRNIGIKNSNSDICIFIDSGILVGTNTVEKFIKLHNRDNDVAIIGYVYGFDRHNENECLLKSLDINPYNLDKYFQILNEKNVLDPREKVYRKLGDNLNLWPAPWVFFWSGFISVKKDTLIRLGMFDENYNTWGHEDLDLGLSLYTNSIKIVLSRDCKCIHYPHEKFKNSISQNKLSEMVIEKRTYMHNKYKLLSTKVFINTDTYELNETLLKMGISGKEKEM